MSKDKKIIELKNLIESAEISLQQARKILVDLVGTEEEKMLADEAKKTGSQSTTEEGQVVEGIFDGQNMVGPDAKKYSVPANYASKSKLVEGDSLKLTITPDGSFVYKQINLLERDRIAGKLTIDQETSEFRVLANNKSYKVLTASITYFKGEEGDQATILVPKGQESTWAAVENIFKAGQAPPDMPEEKGLKEEKKEDKGSEGVKESAKEEPKEETKDEFLSQPEESKPKDQSKLKEEIPVKTDEPTDKLGDAAPIPEKAEDIFTATKETDTDDVKQVDIEPASKEQVSQAPAEVPATGDQVIESSVAPEGAVEDKKVDLSGGFSDSPTGNADASTAGKDSQGLDEL